VPRSLPVQSKAEPPSLEPSEEPLLWEGLTLNKCILVASVVALLSVTFQVLQAPCSKEGITRGRQEPPPPPPPLPEVLSPKEEVPEVGTARPVPPESSALEGGEEEEEEEEEDDSEADSNLAEPWIFKKWFGRATPEDEDKDEDKDEVEDKGEYEDKDEEPTDVPEVPLAATEVKKSQEKQEKKVEKEVEKEEEKEKQ
ncbi:hypothetical protein N305_11884, partial [Manacus vitellinus]